MPRLALFATLLFAAGCARPQEFSAPAPASALDCAVQEAEHLGYTRVAGGEKDGFVRVQILMPPSPAKNARTAPPPHATAAAPPPAPATTVDRDPPEENQLLLHMEGGRLHIQVLSISDEGQPVKPTQDALDHAQMVLARCTS